jgi:hypothetical protein
LRDIFSAIFNPYQSSLANNCGLLGVTILARPDASMGERITKLVPGAKVVTAPLLVGGFAGGAG